MSFGDRRDGKKVRGIHGMQNILTDFKPHRRDSAVYMNVDIDMTEFVKYMDKMKKTNKKLTYYHGLVDVMAKAMYSKPFLNRFVANRTIYMHNKVSFGSTIKEEFEDKSLECLMIVDVKPNDTLLDVSNTVSEIVDRIRNKKTDNIDGAADTLGKLPLFLRVPVVGLLKWLDKHGWLPKSLIEGNLYYSSAILSNLGTFKTNGIYHNLTDFGTASSLITFGEIKKDEKSDKYFMNMGITIDERIADGFYFCTALKLIEYIFAHPDLMMKRAGEKVSIPNDER